MVSILLPFRNAAATLEEAASSVLGDMDRDDDELVLVDDGSTDDGPSIARALAAGSDRRVVVITMEAVGIAGALEAGLATCRGEYIARMDADDVSLAGRLRAQRDVLDRDPSLGVVAAQIELFGAPGEGIQRYATWQNGLVSAHDHARAIFIESPVCHPSTMIRRSALDGVGGYRTGPFAEDYDLWLRLVHAGWGIAKIPQVFLRWRIDATSLTWTHAGCSPEQMRRLRAMHLAKRIPQLAADRPFAIWGAGPAGRRLARELEVYDLRTTFFIDIDPRKIGRTARNVHIVGVEQGIARTKETGCLLIVAVAARGARDLVRDKLNSEELIEGRDYLCAI